METIRGTEGSIDFRKLQEIDRLPLPYQVQLLSQARVQRCVDGQTLFKAGDLDDLSLYLLDGMVILMGADTSVVELRSNQPEARAPIDPFQPRRSTARVVGSATVLQVKRSLLEKLTALAPPHAERGSVLAEATQGGDIGNWMTQIARVPVFAKLPSNNLLVLFERGVPVNVAAGEIVAAQGDAPGSFFVIQEGTFKVSRTTEGSGAVELGELRPGDSFGADALLTERPLDASVTAVTPGWLVRITREDFLKLIVEPLIQAVPLRQAGEMVRTQRARWLDVRPMRMSADIKGEHVLHIPLEELRMRLGMLPRQTPYIVTSDSSTCSRAGVFILIEAGYEARYLTDVAAVSTPAERPESASPETSSPTRRVPPSEPAAELAAQPALQASAPVSAEVEVKAPQAVTGSPAPAAENSVGDKVLQILAQKKTEQSAAPGNPLEELGARINREIDMQVLSLKERVQRELAGFGQSLERTVQEQVRRRAAEVETKFQLMSMRREQALRKSYEHVLALAQSMRSKFDELHQAQVGFNQELSESAQHIKSPDELEQTSGQTPA
jgi:CRP-like cAMP-binding protein